LVGPHTLAGLRGVHVDKLFLGADGLTFRSGVTCANVLEAQVAKAMIAAADEVIVVADSSKIDSAGFTTIIGLTEIDRLVTDAQAPGDFAAALRRQGVEVILAQRLRYLSRVRSLGGEGRCPTNVGLWTTEGNE